MKTLEQKLSSLITKIDSCSYTTDKMKDLDVFFKKVAEDIGCGDPTEAAALIGYLFKYEYAKLLPEKGIILNPDKYKDLQLLR